jgi:hypothetical protein
MLEKYIMVFYHYFDKVGYLIINLSLRYKII